MARPSKYPAEFRQEAVRLALVPDESRAAVARRLGINETTLRNWVADHLAEEARGSDPLALAVSEREELAGHGDPGFVLAAALGDAMEVSLEP